MPDDKSGRLALGSLQIDNVPRWVIALVAMLAAGVAGWLVVGQPTQQLVTQKEANAALQEAVQEYGLHMAETPETQAILMNDARGRMTAQKYADGCVVIVRAGRGTPRSKLILDLARDDHAASSGLGLQLVAPLEAAGRCLNPHPGEFKTWYGARNGCWVQVWRAWPDGCQHYQNFDACHGAWDAPVIWTSCVH